MIDDHALQYMEKDIVTEVTEELLKHLSITFHTLERVEGRVHDTYNISTDDAALLIGENGENLKALTHLVKKIVDQRTNHTHPPFLLDVNGYQRKKIGLIENNARILAERARVFKTEVEMSPMNAYERMLVHNLFALDPDITTQSVGEGKNRRVVIKQRPRDKIISDSF
jgi:spoIIIJ-associated protein